jgi:triosephosphate isomerase
MVAKKIVIGNLKMNLPTLAERDEYLKSLKNEIKKTKREENVEMVLCVPSVYLEFFAKNLKNKKISLGAQNIFWQESGSFTGEISPVMAKECGADYSIIGHSERRKYFNENDQEVNLKIKSAIKNEIIPIVCIGETLQERQEGLIKDVISRQLNKGLEDISEVQVEKIIIAYEPIWAIGADAEPTSDEIMEVRILIRKILTQKYGADTTGKIKVLYGGNVKANLVEKMCLNPQMDGVLVGRESLVAVNFMEIVTGIGRCDV